MNLQKQIDSLPAPTFTVIIAVFVMAYAIGAPLVIIYLMGGR